jgi:hypothetical protein
MGCIFCQRATQKRDDQAHNFAARIDIANHIEATQMRDFYFSRAWRGQNMRPKSPAVKFFLTRIFGTLARA